MFISPLCTIGKIWTRPKCPTIDEWIKKLYTNVEYYATLRKNKSMSFAAAWMEAEDTRLSEVRKRGINTG